jgi:hypothetical protein
LRDHFKLTDNSQHEPNLLDTEGDGLFNDNDQLQMDEDYDHILQNQFRPPNQYPNSPIPERVGEEEE